MGQPTCWPIPETTNPLGKELTMKTLQIRIAMTGEAFTDDAEGEAGRILRGLAERMIRGGFPDSLPLRDYNGNTVGHARLTEEKD